MDIGWPEILIIAVVILILFGSRKMPDAARALGRSLRILKSEVKAMDDDEPSSSSSTPAPTPPAELPAGSPPVTVPSAQSSSSATAGERPDVH